MSLCNRSANVVEPKCKEPRYVVVTSTTNNEENTRIEVLEEVDKTVKVKDTETSKMYEFPEKVFDIMLNDYVNTLELLNSDNYMFLYPVNEGKYKISVYPAQKFDVIENRFQICHETKDLYDTNAGKNIKVHTIGYDMQFLSESISNVEDLETQTSWLQKLLPNEKLKTAYGNYLDKVRAVKTSAQKMLNEKDKTVIKLTLEDATYYMLKSEFDSINKNERIIYLKNNDNEKRSDIEKRLISVELLKEFSSIIEKNKLHSLDFSSRFHCQIDVQLIHIDTSKYKYLSKSNNSQSRDGGQSTTMHILGRKRRLIKQGRRFFITYKKQFIPLIEAKKLEKVMNMKKKAK